MRVVAWHRIEAVAAKEWRLNLRFPLEYLASNVGGPIKTALFMAFLYSGFLRGGSGQIGSVTRDNFQVYVILGGTLHSIFMFAISVFRQRMYNEKYWQTATATFISPINMFEVTLGFLLGSCAVQGFVSAIVLALLAAFTHVSFAVFAASLAVMILMMFVGFGIGIVAATVSLCFEGVYFAVDYSIQILVFLSCFYYPIEIFPKFLHPFIKVVPTFQMVHLLQNYFTTGSTDGALLWLSYFSLAAVAIVAIPAFIFDFAIKKYGITGY